MSPRWLIASECAIVEAGSLAEAMDAHVVNDEAELGDRYIAVDVDAIEGTDRMRAFVVGAREEQAGS